MSEKSRSIHLSLFLQGAGHHVAGWRYPGAEFGGENLAHIINVAKIAEEAKFDAVFLSDNLSTTANEHPTFIARFEPLTLLAALSQATKRIGLIATASTTYSEPFNIARAFASIDLLSSGRSGWNVVTSFTKDSALNFNQAESLGHDARYDRAGEFVDVVRGLWDSWEEGAYLFDRENGRYVDPTKLHELHHEGAYFKVKGPLNVTRSPQGQPVLVQAGSSDSGQNLAARIGEMIFTAQQELDDAKTFYQSLKARLPGFGRRADQCLIMPGVMPIVGKTQAEAEEKFAALQDMISDENASRILSMRLGHDLSGYSLDGPVPDLPPTDSNKSRSALLINLARKQNLTLRQVYRLAAAAYGHRVLVGTAEQIADDLEHWFNEGAADGFNIMPPYLPASFEDFTREVLPILRERGLFRTEYEGSTLREHLGLDVPQNRYTAERS